MNQANGNLMNITATPTHQLSKFSPAWRIIYLPSQKIIITNKVLKSSHSKLVYKVSLFFIIRIGLI